MTMGILIMYFATFSFLFKKKHAHGMLPDRLPRPLVHILRSWLSSTCTCMIEYDALLGLNVDFEFAMPYKVEIRLPSSFSKARAVKFSCFVQCCPSYCL